MKEAGLQKQDHNPARIQDIVKQGPSQRTLRAGVRADSERGRLARSRSHSVRPPKAAGEPSTLRTCGRRDQRFVLKTII